MSVSCEQKDTILQGSGLSGKASNNSISSRTEISLNFVDERDIMLAKVDKHKDLSRDGDRFGYTIIEKLNVHPVVPSFAIAWKM
jgi:hypothetical protein